MPKKFSEMIALLSADERKLLDNTFAKYPDLKDDWKNLEEDGLRQADFSRKQNELAEERKRNAAAIERGERLGEWEQNNWPKLQKLKEDGIWDPDTGENLWEAQKARLEQELADAKAAAIGDGMDAAELDRRVKEIVKNAGVAISQDDMKALIANEAKKLTQESVEEGFKAREKKFNEETIPMVGGFSASTAVLAMHFEKETGEKWDKNKQKELYEMMGRENVFDALELEDKFMAPHREKKNRETEIEAEVKRRLAERGLPGGGGEDYIPQEVGVGALQAMLARSEDGLDPESRIMAGAVAGAKELVAEGKLRG